MTSFTRAYPLDDIQIRAGGDGRTVEAYCAVFDHPTEISDQQGRYREQLDRNAFNKTIKDKGTGFGVFFNHGMTLRGGHSDLGSVPIGSPVEAPRADGRGLLTVSRYNKSALADSVLESIRAGDIRAQSFSGAFVRSTPTLPRGGYRAAGDGTLPLVTRSEIAMTEYGPTPIPAYDVPMVVGVRSRQEIQHRAQQVARVRDHFSRATLSPVETELLTFLLAQIAAADAAIDPWVEAICAVDCSLDATQMIVAALLAVPDPDADADDDEMTDTTPAMASGSRPGTGTAPAATVEPQTHSGRSTAQRVRAALIARGITS